MGDLAFPYDTLGSTLPSVVNDSDPSQDGSVVNSPTDPTDPSIGVLSIDPPLLPAFVCAADSTPPALLGTGNYGSVYCSTGTTTPPSNLVSPGGLPTQPGPQPLVTIGCANNPGPLCSSTAANIPLTPTAAGVTAPPTPAAVGSAGLLTSIGSVLGAFTKSLLPNSLSLGTTATAAKPATPTVATSGLSLAGSPVLYLAIGAVVLILLLKGKHV